MAAIVWDATGSRYYEAGVDQGVLYVQDANGGYETGVPWNGLTSVNESPDGAEPNDLYADNIKYATLRSAETFNATIEAYTYPDEFMECDGSKEVISGVYMGQQSRKAFGFVYRTKIGNDTSSDIDAGYKLHIIYNATASPSDKSYETINDSPDAITLSWEITTTPVTVTTAGYKPVSTIVIDSTKFTETAAKAKLVTLNETLFGSANSDPTLPSPDQIIDIFTKP